MERGERLHLFFLLGSCDLRFRAWDHQQGVTIDPFAGQGEIISWLTVRIYSLCFRAELGFYRFLLLKSDFVFFLDIAISIARFNFQLLNF